MKRLTTIAWQSPAPTSVDERLVVFDDGRAWLVVWRPRELTGPIGTWVGQPSSEDHAALVAAGGGGAPIAFDLLDRDGDHAAAGLRAVADRVAAEARERPHAIATFGAAALEVVGPGRRSIALTVTGGGTEPVEFELDPARCTVQFDGGAAGWSPLPALGSGFVTEDFELLGGLRMAATVPPGGFGASAFEMTVPGPATRVAIQVAGWLTAALPDERLRADFFTRTAEAIVGG